MEGRSEQTLQPKYAKLTNISGGILSLETLVNYYWVEKCPIIQLKCRRECLRIPTEKEDFSFINIHVYFSFFNQVLFLMFKSVS